MISILYGGGTIQSTVTSDGVRTAGSADLLTLLKTNAPEAHKQLHVMGAHDPVAVYDGLSENVDTVMLKVVAERIKEVLQNQESSQAIVTFGTDCMLHFAQYLVLFFAREIQQDNLRIVVTGANKDISHPETDAWDNLSLAVANASGDAGVYIAFGGSLLSVQDAVMAPYNGTAMHFADKNSADYAEQVQKIEVERDEMVEKFRVALETGIERKVLLYPVNRPDILSHSSIMQAAEALDAHIIVFVLYHSGTANVQSISASVTDLVTELRSEHGITCFGATENGETTDLNGYETSVALRKAGLVPLYNMDYMVAFEKAKYMLQLGVAPEKYIEAMYTDCYGEIDASLINKDFTDELIALYSQSLGGQE